MRQKLSPGQGGRSARHGAHGADRSGERRSIRGRLDAETTGGGQPLEDAASVLDIAPPLTMVPQAWQLTTGWVLGKLINR